MPPVLHGCADFVETPARLGHRDHLIQTLSIRRARIDKLRRLPNHPMRVRFHKAQAHHRRHKNGAIGAFRISIDVAKLTRQMSGHIDQPRRQRPINVRAELRANGEPELVVSWVAAVRREDSLLQIEPRLLAAPPGNRNGFPAIVRPVAAQSARSRASQTPAPPHFVIPVVIHRRGRIGMRIIREPQQPTSPHAHAAIPSARRQSGRSIPPGRDRHSRAARAVWFQRLARKRKAGRRASKPEVWVT